MISVIVSTHQGRKERCQKAIQSIIDQTYKDFEVIVVNDAAKDGTNEMVRAFKDPRIKLIIRKECFGNDTKPKNEGILASKGSYISFLDSDNQYLPDHLMVLMNEAKKSPLADVIYGDRLIIDDKGEMDPTIGINSDFNVALLFERNFIDTSDVLIKREALFDVGGFDERYEKYVDWNLWIRMSKGIKKFKHVAKVITNYHLHADMKSLRVKDQWDGKTPWGMDTPERIFKPKWDPMELEIKLPYLGVMSAPTVAVYSLAMNRLEYTKIMYESLHKAGFPFDWYVVDNHSTDGTVEWLKSLKSDKIVQGIHLILNSENVGISVGNNQAIDAMKGKYDFIASIDNDCKIHTDNWLKEMLHIFESHYQILLSPYIEGLVENAGGVPRYAYRNLRGHVVGLTPHLGAICLMMHKSVFDTWRWNEKDFMHGLQDLELTKHSKALGYVCAYVEDLRAEHIDSSVGQMKRFPDYFKERVYQKTHIYKKK